LKKWRPFRKTIGLRVEFFFSIKKDRGFDGGNRIFGRSTTKQKMEAKFHWGDHVFQDDCTIRWKRINDFFVCWLFFFANFVFNPSRKEFQPPP